MSGTAQNLDREFWRPNLPNAPVLTGPPLRVEMCTRCQSAFVVGSRFCHVCGAEREPEISPACGGLARYLDFRFIREAMGLTAGTLIAFFLGLVCTGMAAATGLVYSATTLADWQAVQVWRIEWLLAAAAAFLAGILLKRNG